MPTPDRPILITGADGFVGRHLVSVLGGRAVATTADITDAPAITAEIVAARPRALVHLAAIAAPAAAARDPALAWRTNHAATLIVAHALHAATPGALLLFAGTADAYGASFAPGAALDEAAPLAPLTPYAASKAAADSALGALAADGLNCLRVRPFNHTGPGQSAAFVIPAFARQIARIQAGLQPPIIDAGNLDAARDMLDVRDVCAAYVLAVEHPLPPGTILNLASGRSRRIGDILADLLALAGIDATFRIDPARLRPSETPRAAGSAARAHALLGWTPQIPWQQTLRDVLADWRTRIRSEG